jgi:hypothetical protein
MSGSPSGIDTANKCCLWVYGRKQKGLKSGNYASQRGVFLAFSSQET